VSNDELPESFFEIDGDVVVPTVLCRGPWDPGSSHGGPVAAMVGRQVAVADPDPELWTARITLELIRPVPIAPLRFDAVVVRPGGRVRIIAVSVSHAGQEVARATALRIRRVPTDLAPSLPGDAASFGPPGEATPPPRLVGGGVGIIDGMEVLAVGPAFSATGPATCWFRMLRPLVAGEPADPLATALMAADFGNGISAALPIESHLFINPDLTVYLHRAPVGEWIANSAQTWLQPGQGSVAEATLWDSSGEIGRATQSLYIAAR